MHISREGVFRQRTQQVQRLSAESEPARPGTARSLTWLQGVARNKIDPTSIIQLNSTRAAVPRGLPQPHPRDTPSTSRLKTVLTSQPQFTLPSSGKHPKSAKSGNLHLSKVIIYFQI